jgi:hypothetical protein
MRKLAERVGDVEGAREKPTEYGRFPRNARRVDDLSPCSRADVRVRSRSFADFGTPMTLDMALDPAGVRGSRDESLRDSRSKSVL